MTKSNTTLTSQSQAYGEPPDLPPDRPLPSLPKSVFQCTRDPTATVQSTWTQKISRNTYEEDDWPVCDDLTAEYKHEAVSGPKPTVPSTNATSRLANSGIKSGPSRSAMTSTKA